MASYPEPPSGFFSIDEQVLDQYAFLRPTDRVFYIWEYPTKVWMSHGGNVPYHDYPVYDFINNFQKPNQADNHWKNKAVEHAAAVLHQMLPKDWKTDCTFIPMPPSCIKNDPGYDPRMLDMLRLIPNLDIKEILSLKTSGKKKQKGLTPEARAKNLVLNLGEAMACDRHHLFVVDDVLTTGSHYKAAELVLRTYFKQQHIYCLSLSRAVRPNQAEED